MFVDARELPNNTRLETDVCIMGAGAAGITIAREFAHAPFKVCLLESGDLLYDPDTQFLCQGENVGLPYWPIVASRLRIFGGTTNHWGGICLPLDEDDFEQRDWVPGSGWPLQRADLEPYYQRAQPICQLGKFSYDPNDWQTPDSYPLPFEGDRVVSGITQSSWARFKPPVQFGTAYREDLTRAGNITIYLNANVLEIDTNEAANQVTGLQVACLSGTRFTVQAKSYILALGGIENPRLLLLSNKVQKTGLGNQNDLVGRYFADHLYMSNLGYMIISAPNISTALYHKSTEEHGVQIGSYLALSPKTRRRERLLTSRIHLGHDTWLGFSSGVQALDKLRQALHQGQLPDNLLHYLWRVLKDLDNVTTAAYGNLRDAQVLRFGAWTELVPDPESRVRLGNERDRLGQQRIILDWRIGTQEKESLIRTLSILGEEMGRAGLGRLRMDIDEGSAWPWTGGGTPGIHHMGTTRMHIDAKQGVVDKHCKVHGITNLFIAGSSVFPTYGHANATFTLVALALRLADHLKEIHT